MPRKYQDHEPALPILGPVSRADSGDADALGESVVRSELVHRGAFLSVRVDTVRDARGLDHTRDIVEHPGAVAIIPLIDGELLLVRQFRSPLRRVLLELPAGTLERAGDGSLESPAAAAPRELEEETGHRARTWQKLGSFFTAPGFADEEIHLYLARDLEAVAGYAGPAPDERLDLVRLPWRAAVEMATRGEIQDAKSLVGLFWLARLVERGELESLLLEADQPSRSSASR